MFASCTVSDAPLSALAFSPRQQFSLDRQESYLTVQCPPIAFKEVLTSKYVIRPLRCVTKLQETNSYKLALMLIKYLLSMTNDFGQQQKMSSYSFVKDLYNIYTL